MTVAFSLYFLSGTDRVCCSSLVLLFLNLCTPVTIVQISSRSPPNAWQWADVIPLWMRFHPFRALTQGFSSLFGRKAAINLCQLSVHSCLVVEEGHLPTVEITLSSAPTLDVYCELSNLP